MSTFITVLYVFCCVAAILLFLAVAAFITWYCVVDRPDSRAGHASGVHNWFAPELLAPARHALCAAMNLPGPDVSDYAKCRAGEFQNVPGPAGSPPLPSPTGPGTLLPVAYYTGRSPGQRQLLWRPVDDLPHLQRTWRDDTDSFAAFCEVA